MYLSVCQLASLVFHSIPPLPPSHTHTHTHTHHSNKPGNTLFLQWNSIWEQEAGDRVSAGAKMFLVDQYLPVWVQCTVEGCRKWRKLPPSIELHHVKQEIVRCSDCQRKEDEVGRWWKGGTK